MTPERPVDGNHALMCGLVLGSFLRTRDQDWVAVRVEMLDDAEGNHLDTFRITAASGSYMVSVKKVSVDP